MFSASRNPCDSPSKVMYAYRMPCAARSAAIDSDCAGGTTGSSSPCSSSTGQVASVHVPDRRPLGVQRVALRQRPDQPVQVTRLEVVRVLREPRRSATPKYDATAAKTTPLPATRSAAPSTPMPDVTAASAVQPPAELPRMPSRLPSASPDSARASAAVIASATSTTPHWPRSRFAVGPAVPARPAVVHVDDPDAAAGEEGLLRSSRGTTCEVGPPCTHTMYGGRSPSGPRDRGVGLAGRRSRARPNPTGPVSRAARGTGR